MESERDQMTNFDLLYCAKNGIEEILEEHVPQYDTDKFIRSRTLSENSIIHIAARNGKRPFVEKALALCPGLICEQNSMGDTPLHVAARFGHLEVVKAIVESYGTLSSKSDHEASTPTHISTSVVINVSEITERVAGDKLHPPWNIVNKEGSTALHEALMNGQEKVAMYLLDQDLYLARRVNQANESPLFPAAESGCNQIMEKILGGPEGSYSADGPFDRNPLHAMALSFNRHVLGIGKGKSFRQLAKDIDGPIQILIPPTSGRAEGRHATTFSHALGVTIRGLVPPQPHSWKHFDEAVKLLVIYQVKEKSRKAKES